MADTKPANSAQGLATVMARAESWECDINGHWNTRYYGRVFDEANGVIAALAGEQGGGGASKGSEYWHLRFHRELMSADVFTVGSYRAASASLEEATVHRLSHGETLAATALFCPGFGGSILPQADMAALRPALPKGLGIGAPVWEETAAGFGHHSSVLGLLGAESIDQFGRLRLEHLLRYASYSMMDHRARLGFGADFTREHAIGRMNVEMRIALEPAAQVGQVIGARSKVIALGEKTIVSAHLLHTQEMRPLASFETCALAVDLATRRAVKLPSFLRDLPKTL